MRPDGWARRPGAPKGRALRGILALAVGWGGLGVAVGVAAQPVGPVSPPAASAASPDTLPPSPLPPGEARRGAPGDTIGPAARALADVEEQRKRGEFSLGEALRGRRAQLLVPLPLFGMPAGALLVPDAGSKLRASPLGVTADGSTDRTLAAAPNYGVGVFDLAAALDDPRVDGIEMLDVVGWKGDLEPELSLRAGELLAEPRGERAFTRVMPGEATRERRARSALHYANGDAGELETGVRFVSPSLFQGIGASYARHEGDGVEAIRHSLSTRYAAAVGLPRTVGHALWAEGRLFEWTVEDVARGINPATSEVEELPARAELATRDVALHGRFAAKRGESAWSVQAGSAKRTRVEPGGLRDRWSLPELSLRWHGSLEAGSGWTALAAVAASSRRIEHHYDATVLVDSRRDEVRGGLGLRRSLGPGLGFQTEAHLDGRETALRVWDGRASLWKGSSRASGRVDLEWFHERPTWVDLLAPARQVVSPRSDQLRYLELDSSGDPSLKPRRLAGALARASYELSPSIVLQGEGSIRHVKDDFGWDLTRVETTDTLFVTTRAARRGDAWASFGAIGVQVRQGPFGAHGTAWMRGGPGGISPRAGSPSRHGADAAVSLRVVLFDGDLPMEAGVEVHAQGPRRGVIREPGWGSLDAALRADFGPAGAFAEFVNVLDHRIPSGVLDLESGRAVDMPERSFHFGVVWYLVD